MIAGLTQSQKNEKIITTIEKSPEKDILAENKASVRLNIGSEDIKLEPNEIKAQNTIEFPEKDQNALKTLEKEEAQTEVEKIDDDLGPEVMNLV